MNAGRIIRYLLPYKQRMVAVALVSVILSLLTLTDAWLMGRLTDAIFYRSRGLPLSITWQKNNASDYKEFTVVFTKKGPWSAADRQNLIRKEKGYGVTVLSSKINGDSITERIRVSKNVAGDPVQMVNELQAHLRPNFGVLHSYIAVGTTAPASPKSNLTLFPQFYTVYIIPVVLIIVYFFEGIFKYGQGYLLGAVSQRVLMQLRNEIYENLQNLSISYFERNQTGQTGQLISRITNDIDAIYFLFASGVIQMLLEPLVVVLGFIWGLILNWKLVLLFVLIMPLIAFPVNRLSRLLRKVNISIMNKVADITGVLEETLSGIKVVKAFGMEDHEVQRFHRETRASYDAAMRGIRVSNALSPIIDFMIAIGLAIFITYAGTQVLGETLTPGEFFTFSFLISFMANPIRKISSVYSNIPRALAAADRVFEIIDQKSEVVEAADPIDLPEIQGAVRFENVAFGYSPETIVLHDINLDVQPGEVIAFVGPSGAGKTTMINLIARFYDPLAGRVLIDGCDLSQLKIASFRRQMGIVPQETILFRGTVAENIAYGKIGATMAGIEAAARAANVAEFVEQLPDGYQTRVGSRGATLSGGQRQRVAIARALLRDPRILILDEATSALDTQSEVLVQEALERLMRNRTCFVIAHRLSTIRSANRIVVLEKGTIVETGTHEQLLEKGGLYATLYRTQFRNQESELEKSSGLTVNVFE